MMQKIIDWFSSYWYFALLFVAVCIVAFFIFRAAARAYKNYYTNYKEQEQNIKRLVQLNERFCSLTAEELSSFDDEENILEGVALTYQLKLQKSDDMEKAFNELSLQKQYIYALDVFREDACLEVFFKANGSELKNIIAPAFCMIGLTEEGERIERISAMYDEKNLTVSIDEDIVNETEQMFKENDILTKIKHCAAKYIKENAQLFV